MIGSSALIHSIVSSRRGFALVITLVMVALAGVIAIGVFTSVSVERVTATSYNNRYQADLAAQNGLASCSKDIGVATSPGRPHRRLLRHSTDTFLVVRADGRADANGNKAAYYYLAQPRRGAAPTITYYPLFSASTDPTTSRRCLRHMTINLATPFAPCSADSSPSCELKPDRPHSRVERRWNTATAEALFMAATESEPVRAKCEMGRDARPAGCGEPRTA